MSAKLILKGREDVLQDQPGKNHPQTFLYFILGVPSVRHHGEKAWVLFFLHLRLCVGQSQLYGELRRRANRFLQSTALLASHTMAEKDVAAPKAEEELPKVPRLELRQLRFLVNSTEVSEQERAAAADALQTTILNNGRCWLLYCRRFATVLFLCEGFATFCPARKVHSLLFGGVLFRMYFNQSLSTFVFAC